MDLTQIIVTPQDLARSGAVRLDPKYHYYRHLASPIMDALRVSRPLGELVTFANGANIPRSAYADDDSEPWALYASVAPLSSIAFRRECCVPLRESAQIPGKVAGTRIEAQDLSVTNHEVLITRSRASAPGLAWPGDAKQGDTFIIPSGFLIRARVIGDEPPGYLAAVLNHPAWRFLTAALAAGKSQDNLSQELLSTVPIPVISAKRMEKIASEYHNMLSQIDDLYESESSLASLCDGIINEYSGLVVPDLPNSSFQVRTVSMFEVAETRQLRIDNRWHGSANADMRHTLKQTKVVPLGDLLQGLPMKGRQPVAVREEDVDEDTFYAIATSTLQSGSIAWDRAKPTNEESVKRFVVRRGDLLVAMDGDGSLGKAAVYDRDDEVTVDSHVARCRVKAGKGMAEIISCWLNSTWGRVQTTALMTGSTGQTALAPDDLIDVIVAESVVGKAPEISETYRAAISGFEPVTRRSRRLLCGVESKLTSALIEEKLLLDSNDIKEFVSVDDLMKQMDILYPSKRT